MSQEEFRESFRMLVKVQKIVREWTFTLPREFNFGSWSFDGLLNLQKAISGVKTQWLEESFI
jgi:hypothetical protein